MSKRITIKDIAKKANVSVGTVHCALTGKPGVGEATRHRIVEIAQQYNYKTNAVAASLKRKTIHIAAAFPGPTEENRFYYTNVWEGVRECIQEMSDYNIEIIEVPYYGGMNNQADGLEELLDRTKVDGLITQGYTDMRGRISVKKFVDKNIPVVLIGSDLTDGNRLCCVQPNYDIIGRTLAELITRQIPSKARILLCAGDMLIPSHYEVVQGFESYIQENELLNDVYKIYANTVKQDVYEHIVHGLVNKQVEACCGVNARSSMLLGKALIETGKAGKMIAVGSDLFEENTTFLRDGVFTNLLQKNPYSQAYLGAKYLVEYLLRGTKPPQEVVFIGSEIVFQSSLPMYDNSLYRLLS